MLKKFNFFYWIYIFANRVEKSGITNQKTFCMKRNLLLAFLALFLGVQVYGQVNVTGTVTFAEDNSTLPGVTVLVKGTVMGTITDLDGKYEISVPESATALTFSYVGMVTQEVAIGSSSVIDVVMQVDALGIDEVVVTALGISREKKSLGYATQELDGEELNRVRETNVVSSLSGKVSGVSIRQPNTMGGSANILIRGSTSLTQNNQALFVIDGVPFNNNNTNEDRVVANSTASTQNDGWGGYDYGNAAMDINPDDIASVTVLKGAAATALYGSKAANGVILITTKKGSADRKKGIGISINSGIMFSNADKSTMPQHQDKYGGGYGPFYEDPSHFFFYSDIDGDGNDDLIAPTSEDASWGAAFDPGLMVIHWDALDPDAPNYGEKRPWVAGENGIDYFFSTGVKATNNIAFDGANKNGNFRLSYTNMDEVGMLPNSSIKKNNINFGGNYNFTDRLSVDATMNFTNTSAVGRYGTGYDGWNPMQSFGQWFQRNVDLKRVEEKYLRADGSQLSWNHGYYDDLHPIYFDNPYWVRHKNYQDDHRNRIFSLTSINYELADWLSVVGRVGIDDYTEVQNERVAKGSVDLSYYSNFTRHFRNETYDLFLNANKNFGDISLAANIGTSANRTNVESVLGETAGGLVVPDLYTVSNSVSPVSITESLVKSGTNSIFGRVSLGYKGMVYLDLAARNDVSSTLPEDNNSYLYPSASLGLILTEMGGLGDIDWLSFLKIRANYAQVGNDAPAYSTVSTYSQGTSWGDLALFSVNSTLQNPDLKPERTTSTEFGLDARLFNSRLNFDIAYYMSSTFDQIMPVLVSPSSGVTRRFVNGGEIENKGWEISATGTPVKTADLSWDIGVNWWKNNNLVVSLYEDVENLLIYSAWDASINATVGQPYGSIRGTDYIWTNGEPTVGANGYYMKTAGDTVIGNINPDWNMGINTRVNWKGLSFYALIDIQQGGDIYSINTKYGQATGLYEETAENNVLGNPMRDNLVHKDNGDLGAHYTTGLALADADPTSGGYILPGVKADGTENDLLVASGRWGRAFYYNNSPTARYVFDASYVKLRELALSYTLPASVVSKTPFSNIAIALVGRNVAILSKNTKHFDPEASLSSGNQQGIETGSYPTPKQIGVDLKIGL